MGGMRTAEEGEHALKGEPLPPIPPGPLTPSTGWDCGLLTAWLSHRAIVFRVRQGHIIQGT